MLRQENLEFNLEFKVICLRKKREKGGREGGRKEGRKERKRKEKT
jgi:hypothetical protein